MYVKKRMSLLLFAALAMVLFTACGRWDFSREAAKAANEAQGETLRVEFTVEQKIAFILESLESQKSVRFEELFTHDFTKSEIVTTFQAMLELLKHQYLRVTQTQLFGEITISMNPDRSEEDTLGEIDEYN